MRSIADALRADTRAQDAALTPAERVARALDLGDRDADLFAKLHTIPVAEARRQLARQRQHGRRRSVCHDALDA
jgi:hypothetical protein